MNCNLVFALYIYVYVPCTQFLWNYQTVDDDDDDGDVVMVVMMVVMVTTKPGPPWKYCEDESGTLCLLPGT